MHSHWLSKRWQDEGELVRELTSLCSRYIMHKYARHASSRYMWLFCHPPVLLCTHGYNTNLLHPVPNLSEKTKKINFSQISYFCNLSDVFDYKHKMKNDGCQEFSAMTTMMYEVYKPRGSAGPQSLGVGRHTPGPRTCIPKPDLLPHISNTRLKQCFWESFF